ncbi:hypothetical protein DCAR_0934378 [Daucus carota subsp. sativus]|uniref:Uncharacterized protein n=1 Tax=Daucus carota subsp. sativus TaxID=79200 RepID=A0A175YBJ0_DAUCS|nr:PREDICTED: uncharacterized protein LOC108192465 [Daucus carota subsp. sativus]WOH14852.1 hypothetical protein DCAR_0934378 [Daucus carota subsp. sativus]
MGSGRKGKPAAVIEQDSVFASVPSRAEVEKAISELQSFLDGDVGSSPKSSERNRLIQMLNNDEVTKSPGYRRVQEAYHLLKTDSTVRKVVMSISSDKAVWNAVLSNKAVKDLRGSLKQAQISDEELDWAATILQWIFKIAMSFFTEMMAKLGLLIGEMFQKAKAENLNSEVIKNFDGRLETLLLLSVVILIIVVVARSHEGTPDD